MEKRQRVEWLDLPTELWTMIAKHLIIVDKTTFELCRFRSICKTWRSAHPLPQRTPIARIRFRHDNSFLLQTNIYRLELLSQEPVIDQHPSISSSKGWFIMLGKSESMPLHFLNPFTRSSVSKTRKIFSFNSLPRVLNITKFKAMELVETFNLFDKRVRKVVLFPSFTVERRMVCALFTYRTLCVCKIRDKKWTMIKPDYYESFHGYHDIIIHKGQLYVIDRLGTIFWMNPLSLKLAQFTEPLWSWYNGKTKQMVECGGRLYVVDMPIEERYLHKKVDIKVYTVHEESGRWEVVKNLGDVVFVLGKVDSNFFLSAQDYHGCVGNCIYFSYPSNIFRIFSFNLKDSMLKTPTPFWPCPSLYNY